MEVREVANNVQYIHCTIYDLCGNFLFWFTLVYGLNQLEHGRRLWMDIDQIHLSQQGPWFLIGDFNNVLKTMDKRGKTWFMKMNIRTLFP